MNFNKKVFIAFNLLFLSGCSMFTPIKTDSETNFRLNAAPQVAVKKTRPLTLLVSEPESSPVFNSRQMAYSNRPYQIAYFAKNHWAESPAKMLQQLIVQSIQNTHYYKAILTPPSVGQFDYVLSTQLLEFQQDFTHNPSVVHISLRTQLIQTSTYRVLAAKQFSVTQPTKCNTPYSGVVAANIATARLLKQVTEFAVQSRDR